MQHTFNLCIRKAVCPLSLVYTGVFCPESMTLTSMCSHAVRVHQRIWNFFLGNFLCPTGSFIFKYHSCSSMWVRCFTLDMLVYVDSHCAMCTLETLPMYVDVRVYVVYPLRCGACPGGYWFSTTSMGYCGDGPNANTPDCNVSRTHDHSQWILLYVCCIISFCLSSSRQYMDERLLVYFRKLISIVLYVLLALSVTHMSNGVSVVYLHLGGVRGIFQRAILCMLLIVTRSLEQSPSPTHAPTHRRWFHFPFL